MIFLTVLVPLVEYVKYKRKQYRESYDTLKEELKTIVKESIKSCENNKNESAVDERVISPGNSSDKRKSFPSEGDRSCSELGFEKYLPELFSYKPKEDKDKDFFYNIERRCKLPRTLDEYYSYNTESRRGKEISFVSKEVHKNRQQDTWSSDEDRRRYVAWTNYQMDYMGIDCSDNIIRKLTNTLNTPQYHEYTHLPNNKKMETFPGYHPYHYESCGPPPPSYRKQTM